MISLALVTSSYIAGGTSMVAEASKTNLHDIYGQDYSVDLGTNDLIVLPSYFDDQLPIYDGTIFNLAEDLRASGVDAAYLHDPEHQVQRIRESFEETFISFVVSIASSAAWDGFISLLRRRRYSRIDATIVDMRLPNGTHIRIRKLSGSAPDVLEAMERLRDQDDAT